MSALSVDVPTCNVHVQSIMIHYITMSRGYATADSVRNQENAHNSPDPFSLAEGGVWGQDYPCSNSQQWRDW